jgi:ATP-dependent RNA helicase DHX36
VYLCVCVHVYVRLCVYARVPSHLCVYAHSGGDARSNKTEVWRTVPIHGKMNPSAQQAAFDRVPPGERKIVLSTNVAESSITIDDVVFVVDCGVEKALNTNPTTGMSFLCSVWVSKASAMQRLGRAGRVCNGYCFRLFSSEQASRLLDYAIPEIQTRPIDDVVLLAKYLNLSHCIETFMSELIEVRELVLVVAR